MNFHYPVQACYRSRVPSRFVVELGNQKVFSLSGDKRLWRSVGKMLFILGVFLSAVHLWQAATLAHLEQSTVAAANIRNEHMERQIGLQSKRAQLLSPERVLVLAAEKLSLHVPEQEQVKLVQ